MSVSSGLALAAGLLQLAGLAVASIATIKGRMQPSTTSFGIWTLVSFSLLVTSYAAGATTNLPFITAGALGTACMFGLSFKYGYRNWSWIDPVSITLAVLSLVLWYLTKNAAYAIYILTLIDWIAIAPIIRKSWIDPSSESRSVWLLTLAASICLVTAITDWVWAVAVVAITQLLHASIINILIRWPHPHRNKGLARAH